MGYKPLNRPNNFMYGAKPWEPAVYDENITPLEQLNKLAYKLNEIIADDTNVKNEVDKLLGVWKDVFMAKAGYVPAIETIYSENRLKGELTGVVKSDNEYKLFDNKYIDIDDRYKPIELLCTTENNTVCNMIWEYWNGEDYIAYQIDTDISSATSTIYLPTKGENFTYRVKLQNNLYTSYAYLAIYVHDTYIIDNFNFVSNVYNDKLMLSIFTESKYTFKYDCYQPCIENLQLIFKDNAFNIPLNTLQIPENLQELNVETQEIAFDGSVDFYTNWSETVQFRCRVVNNKHSFEKYITLENIIPNLFKNITIDNTIFNMHSTNYIFESLKPIVETEDEIELNYKYVYCYDFDSATDFGRFVVKANSISGIWDLEGMYNAISGWTNNLHRIYRTTCEIHGIIPLRFYILTNSYVRREYE